jgi:hypothetical protein
LGGTILVAFLGCACLAAANAQPTSAWAARNASAPGSGSAREAALLAVTRRRAQSVLFWLGWDGGKLRTIPWNAVTQVDLFSLATCVKAGDPAPDCAGPTSLSQQFNGVTHPRSFVRTVHRHRKLAIVSTGGSTNPNWYYACDPSDVDGFAANLVAYMNSNGFDGIDLDIEQDAGTGNPALTADDLRTCTETVYRDAKATRTSRGRAPLITTDVDPTTNFDIGHLQAGYVDQFNAMSYGVHGSKLASEIKALETKSGIPRREITAGLDIGDYRTPASECGSAARLARRKHLAGTMLWYGQADAPKYPCLRAIAHNLR